jgi:CBS domain-containing protein
MPRLRDLPLVPAAVPVSATFGEAVAALFAASVPTLAVLDEDERVAGVFGEGDLLRAVFPDYLAEVRHTAFLDDDAAALADRAREVRDAPIRRYLRPAETLSAGASQTHAAERFLHTGEQALPVVEGERFLGMLSIAALCHARLGRLDA